MLGEVVEKALVVQQDIIYEIKKQKELTYFKKNLSFNFTKVFYILIMLL